jgi:hypothetical protein
MWVSNLTPATLTTKTEPWLPFDRRLCRSQCQSGPVAKEAVYWFQVHASIFQCMTSAVGYKPRRILGVVQLAPSHPTLDAFPALHKTTKNDQQIHIYHENGNCSGCRNVVQILMRIIQGKLNVYKYDILSCRESNPGSFRSCPSQLLYCVKHIDRSPTVVGKISSLCLTGKPSLSCFQQTWYVIRKQVLFLV